MPIPHHRMHGASRVSRGLRFGTDPLTADVTYTPAEVEFGAAMEKYQRTRGRRYPTWAEVLRVAEALGYRRAAPPECDD
jgi:hypothetical protein